MNESLHELGVKLSELDCSQNSIQKASEEFLNIAKNDESRMEDLVKMWKYFCINKNNKLAYLYLVNDIIQNSFFQKLKFHEVFYDQIIDAFAKVYHTGNNKLKKEILRLLDIWNERNVYTSNNLENLKQLLINLPNISNQESNLIISYLINNKVKIPQKIIDYTKGIENFQRYYEINNESTEMDIESENKIRESLIRESSEFIKKESQVYSKHVLYLQEVDRLLDKIYSYKKLNQM
jgi:hypothetical protein